MSTRYLLLFALTFICTIPVQAKTLEPTQATEAKTSHTIPPTPSLHEEILDHYIFWILLPILESVLIFPTMLIVKAKLTEDVKSIYGATLVVALLNMVVASAVASWKRQWTIAEQEDEMQDLPPFKYRFRRVFRFLSCTICCALPFHVLVAFSWRHFKKHEPRSYFVYPSLLSLLIALGCYGYDRSTKPSEEQATTPKKVAPFTKPSTGT